MIYTGPIYSTILAAIFLKEKLSIKSVICIIAVVVGMLFIVGIITPEGLTLSLDPSYAFGNAIAFASGIAYGLYLFSLSLSRGLRFQRSFLVELPVRFAFHPRAARLASLLPAAAFLSREMINGVTQFDATGQIITHPWNLFTMDGSSWAWLIAAALITGFGAFYLLTHATKRLKAGELAAISYQETIMASLLGLLLFGETMTAFQVIGGALIIAGGVSQVVFSTKSAGAKGEKIEKEAEIRENLATRIEEESEKEGLK